MKPARRLPLFLLALFIASLLLPGLAEAAANRSNATGAANLRAARGMQSVRGMTRRNARKSTSEGIIENIDETWYLEFTPAYVKTSYPIGKFYGASVALGWRITQNDQLQLELGYYQSGNFSSAYSYTRDGTDPNSTAFGAYSYYGTAGNNNPNSPPYNVGPINYAITMNGACNAKATMIPLLLSYNFCIWLDSPGRWELKITPIAGLIVMNDTWNLHATGSFESPDGTIIDPANPKNIPNDGNSTIRPDGSGVDRSESFSGHDSNYIASAMGGGFSFTYNFADRCYVSAGYRYLWTGVTANKQNLSRPTGTPWNGVNTWNGMNTHYYYATLGWKF